MKEITLKAIEKTGFEIIENVDDCYVSAPIVMDSIEGGKLSDLEIGSYDIDTDRQEIDGGNSWTTFTILQNGAEIEFDISIDRVKEYFKKYFKDHPDEL